MVESTVGRAAEDSSHKGIAHDDDNYREDVGEEKEEDRVGVTVGWDSPTLHAVGRRHVDLVEADAVHLTDV